MNALRKWLINAGKGVGNMSKDIARELEKIVNYSLDSADCVDYNIVADYVKAEVLRGRINQWEKVVLRSSKDSKVQKAINDAWLEELNRLTQKLNKIEQSSER